jgi:hypothetical protein
MNFRKGNVLMKKVFPEYEYDILGETERLFHV